MTGSAMDETLISSSRRGINPAMNSGSGMAIDFPLAGGLILVRSFGEIALSVFPAQMGVDLSQEALPRTYFRLPRADGG